MIFVLRNQQEGPIFLFQFQQVYFSQIEDYFFVFLCLGSKLGSGEEASVFEVESVLDVAGYKFVPIFLLISIVFYF